MPELHIYAIYAVFGCVILCITFNLLDMTLTAMMGLSLLTIMGVIGQKDILSTPLSLPKAHWRFFLEAWWWRVCWFLPAFSKTSGHAF